MSITIIISLPFIYFIRKIKKFWKEKTSKKKHQEKKEIKNNDFQNCPSLHNFHISMSSM